MALTIYVVYDTETKEFLSTGTKRKSIRAWGNRGHAMAAINQRAKALASAMLHERGEYLRVWTDEFKLERDKFKLRWKVIEVNIDESLLPS